MVTSIKANLNKPDGQTNLDKDRVTAQNFRGGWSVDTRWERKKDAFLKTLSIEINVHATVKITNSIKKRGLNLNFLYVISFKQIWIYWLWVWGIKI